MQTILKGRLENKIDEWLQEIAEEDELSKLDIYVHDSLVKEMGDAASAVFDATVNIQKWIEAEKMDE